LIDAGREVCINGTLMWRCERGGSYVPCSHLRLLEAGGGGGFIACVHTCWTTSGHVYRVGLWAGKSVELDHRWVGLWKHENP